MAPGTTIICHDTGARFPSGMPSAIVNTHRGAHSGAVGGAYPRVARYAYALIV